MTNLLIFIGKSITSFNNMAVRAAEIAPHIRALSRCGNYIYNTSVTTSPAILCRDRACASFIRLTWEWTISLVKRTRASFVIKSQALFGLV